MEREIKKFRWMEVDHYYRFVGMIDKGGLKKPILRSLKDITYTEATEIADIIKPENKGKHPVDDEFRNECVKGITEYGKFYALTVAVPLIDYLLKRHFDLFGFIDSGQAYNKKLIK